MSAEDVSALRAEVDSLKREIFELARKRERYDRRGREVVGVRFSIDTIEALEEAARDMGTSRGHLIRQFVENELAKRSREAAR